MTINEAYVEWFEKPMREYIKTEPKEVIDYVQENPDSLVIKERVIGIDEVKQRAQDPNYLKEHVTIEDGILVVNDFNDDVINFVKKYAPKSITQLEVPNTFFSDVTILESFPNLTTVVVNGYLKLSPEEIDFIKEKTNITEISSPSGAIVKYDYKPRPGEILLHHPSEVFISGNLTSRANKKSFPTSRVEAVIAGTDIDFNLLDKACKNAIFNDQQPVDSIVLKSVSLPDQKVGDNELLKLELNEDGEITLLEYNGKDDVTKLAKVVKDLEKNKKIHKIVLKCENKSYDNLYYLNSLAKKYDLQIDYGDLHKCTLEEFSAMRETIDWFNELVQSANLSPAETLLFAYDIMKTFKYKENNENKDQSRYLHNIVMSEYIVCVGYAKFMEQLLKENGIAAEEIGVSCNIDKQQPDGHARNLVRLDDDKYDIHGVFCIDATWDSTRDRLVLVETKDNERYVQYGVNPGDTVERDFDTDGLYRNFLVPARDYPKVYPKDSIPAIMRRTLEGTLDELKEEPKNFLDKDYSSTSSIETLFGKGANIDDVKDYMRVKRPSLEVFKRMLYNVRIAQGYTPEEAIQSIEDNVELNQMIDELNRPEPTFFQSSQKK